MDPVHDGEATSGGTRKVLSERGGQPFREVREAERYVIMLSFVGYGTQCASAKDMAIMTKTVTGLF